MTERRRLLRGRRSFYEELEEAREANDVLLNRVQVLRRLDEARFGWREDQWKLTQPETSIWRERPPRRLENPLDARLARLQRLVARLAVDRYAMREAAASERSMAARRAAMSMAFGKWARSARSISPLRRELEERRRDQERLGHELSQAVEAREEVRRMLANTSVDLAQQLANRDDADKRHDAELTAANAKIVALERRLQIESTLRLEAEGVAAEREAAFADLAACEARLKDALGPEIDLEARRVSASVAQLVDQLTRQRDDARRSANNRDLETRLSTLKSHVLSSLARRLHLFYAPKKLSRAFHRWKTRGIVLIARTQLVSSLTHCLQDQLQANLDGPANNVDCIVAVLQAALRPFDLAHTLPARADHERAVLRYPPVYE